MDFKKSEIQCIVLKMNGYINSLLGDNRNFLKKKKLI